MDNNNDSLINGLELFKCMINETPLEYFGDPVLQEICTPIPIDEISTLSIELANLMCKTLTDLRHKTGFGRGLQQIKLDLIKE